MKNEEQVKVYPLYLYRALYMFVVVRDSIEHGVYKTFVCVWHNTILDKKTKKNKNWCMIIYRHKEILLNIIKTRS